jgi:hypothetical protein
MAVGGITFWLSGSSGTVKTLLYYHAISGKTRLVLLNEEFSLLIHPSSWRRQESSIHKKANRQSRHKILDYSPLG